MRNLFLMLTVIFIANFSGVAAIASPGLPMVSSPLASGDDLAIRIETGNGLTSGADYVSAFSQVRPELGISTPAGAAEEARGLHSCSPTAGKYTVSCVKDGKTSKRVRPVSSQESALCDENGNVIALMKCGNIAAWLVEHLAPPPTPVVMMAPPVPVAYQPKFVSWGRGHRMSPDEISRAFDDCPGGHCARGQILGFAGDLAKGAGAAAAGWGIGWGIRGAKAATNTMNQTFNGAHAGSGPPSGGGPVNPPEYPPSNADGSPVNPSGYDYWQ